MLELNLRTGLENQGTNICLLDWVLIHSLVFTALLFSTVVLILGYNSNGLLFFSDSDCYFSHMKADGMRNLCLSYHRGLCPYSMVL